MSLGGKSSVFYNTFKKNENMKRLDHSVPKIDRTTQRINFQSIYRRESAPDYYDSVKVAEVHKGLITKNKNPHIDMKKQVKRNYESLLNGTDFYKNVQRDNARQDYIKRLLEAN